MQVDLKAAIFVLGAVLSFSLVLPVFGLVPGIVVLTVVGSFADGKLSILSALLLSVALVLIGYAVFVFALSIQVDNFSWPW